MACQIQLETSDQAFNRDFHATDFAMLAWGEDIRLNKLQKRGCRQTLYFYFDCIVIFLVISQSRVTVEPVLSVKIERPVVMRCAECVRENNGLGQ